MTHYESLDSEVHGICSKAERKCKPKWAGHYEWSPDLAHAITQVSYWRLQLKHKEETAVIQKMGKELDVPFVSLPKDLLYSNLQSSKARLRKVQENARQYRQDHLKDLAQKYAEQNNVSTQTAITEIMAHEDK